MGRLRNRSMIPEIQSEAMDVYIAERLAALGADPDPITVLRTVAHAFLPIDDVSRRSMLVYQGFAAAALTDPTLRRSEMFTRGRVVIQFFATQLAHLSNHDDPHRCADPDRDATGLLSLLLGLSIAVLLEQTTPAEAADVLDWHLDRLTS